MSFTTIQNFKKLENYHFSESPHSAGDPGSISLGKFPWRREWLSTPLFVPGEFHGQRSLAGYSPWGHKEAGYSPFGPQRVRHD